jgi:hypothetical protein
MSNEVARPTMTENGRPKGNGALLLALAAGQTVRDAARTAGLGERTVRRRLADPDFRRGVSQLRGEMVDRALGRAADGMSEAADMLRRLLRAKRENIRLGAARSLLEFGVRLRESVELEARLAALEKKIGVTK